MKSHAIDHEIGGHDMQYVMVTLDPNETVVAEAGAMMFMENGVTMETQMGDGSRADEGLLGKLFGAGKRVLMGESIFMTAFTAKGEGRKKVAFAAPYPGKIIPLHLAQLGGSMICQRDAFLCAAKGTSIDIAFTKKLGAGFFGGEGFVLEKLSGDGWAFVHACGSIIERELAKGEVLRVDTGCLVAFQESVQYDIQMVPGLKSVLFGGEGLFFATLTGPGKIFLQSLPFSRMADRIYAAAPKLGGQSIEQGGVLGQLGNILGGKSGL